MQVGFHQTDDTAQKPMSPSHRLAANTMLKPSEIVGVEPCRLTRKVRVVILLHNAELKGI